MTPNLPTIHDCTGCGACIDTCNQAALRLSEEENGFFVPKVNEEKCIACRACEKKCPILNPIKTRHDVAEEQAFAAWSEEKDIIEHSASGGVFAQIAKEFLQKDNTIVVGATLTPDSKVKHVIVREADELIKLQNSKYQQSDTTGIYKAVKAELRQGTKVLFSGTPCQIAALYAYLGQPEKYDNLFTAEVICHGVPSNYLSELALRVENADAIASYRTKSRGWEKGNRTVYIKNGETVECDRWRKDFHFRAYLSFLWLRPSCNHCPFATINRVADITLGDFWGCRKEQIHKEGISVVLVNSPKGNNLFFSTQRMHRHLVSWSEVTRLNQNIYAPTIQGSGKALDIHYLRNKPLWLQKLIFQDGFTNKWLFGATNVIRNIITFGSNNRMRKTMLTARSAALANVLPRPRVSILTTYFAANFGAMLQPYALMRVIEEMGFDVDFIRYKQQSVYDGHRALSLKRIFKDGIKSAVNNIFALPFALVQDTKMQRFKNHYLRVDDKFDKCVSPNSDYYIFGSDQIWNPRNTNGFDKIYFGDFPVKQGAKKIVYAASGELIDDTAANAEFLKNHLSNFDALSVRESTLRDKLQQMTGISNIDVVCDPTLLAPKRILDELPDRTILHDPYVLFYHVRNSVAFLPKIHEFAQSKGCKLVIISGSPKKSYLSYAWKHKDVLYLPTAGMEEFLGGVRNAQYVFSASFHGNVFALLYHKPLFSMALNDGMDTRTHDLLHELNAEHRIITLADNFDHLPPMDYNTIDVGIEQMRQHGTTYLKKALFNQ